MKAIETTGTIDAQNHLVLDEPLDMVNPSRVRIIILLPEEDDINEKEWLKTASKNPAFDYLRESPEDIYKSSDGEPFNDQG